MAINSLLRVFLCSLRIVVSMLQRCLRCWLVPILPLLMIHIVCQNRVFDVVPYAWLLVFCSLVHLFKFIFGPLEKGSRISNEWHSPGIYPFYKVSASEFSSSPEIFLLDFVFYFHLCDGVGMPNSNPISWLYILTVCISFSSSFSFFANSLMSSIELFLRYTKFVSGYAFSEYVVK